MNHYLLFNRLQQIIPSYILKNVQTHPFNRALYNGTLPYPIFKAFLEQDKLYLLAFSKSLQKVAERVEKQHHQALFRKLSVDAFNAHFHLHDKYLMNISNTSELLFFPPREPIIDEAISVVCDYIDYQFDMASHAEIELAIASLMPCFVIYSYLGLLMQHKLYSSHPYHRWIASYAGDGFLLSTTLIIEAAKEYSEGNPAVVKQKMDRVFEKSAHYEITFWTEVLNKSSKCANPGICFSGFARS